MPKSRFTFNLLTCLAVATGSLVLSSAPASAAVPTLSRIELDGTTHFDGSAVFGATTSAAMGATSLPTPYAYGQYAVIWNLSNPNKKEIRAYSISRYRCETKSGADLLSNNTNADGCDLISSTLQIPSTNQRAVADETFSEVIGKSDFHGKWLRLRYRVTFDDGTEIKNWSLSRLYIHDAARSETPIASIRGANGRSVPQSTTMSMTFNAWQGLSIWQLQSPVTTRSTRIYRCTSLPSDAANVIVPNSSTPSGCTLLITNTAFDTNIDNLALSFTTGPKGSYIYAIDTVAAFLKQSSGTSPVVQLQKRAIYSTYDPAELPAGPAPGADGADPGAALTALQMAGIDTTVAPIVSETGQVTSNGITAVIDANGRYKRGTQRRAIKVRIQPNNKSQGAVVAALVSSAGGVDTVHLAKTKTVRNGKARWRWRFPDTLPRGRYKIYVSFTPTDATVNPMTITKRVRLR